jgi:hypothetical protein
MLATAGLILNVLLVAFKAVPVLKEVWDRLLVMYLEKKKAELAEEVRLAIYNAVHSQDQRGIEKAIGSPNAGQPVEISDSQIVDRLPGVTPHPKSE